MVEKGRKDEQQRDFGERLAADHQILKDGWSRTLQDMTMMAEDRRDRGYTVAKIGAGDTAPEPPGAGDSDRYGLVFVIPDNKAERFKDLYDPSSYDETAVYQNEVGDHVFVVVENIDTGGNRIIMLGGQYAMRNAPELVRHATKEGTMYTHVQTLDTTELGTFEHEDVSAFFPNPDRYKGYEYDPDDF